MSSKFASNFGQHSLSEIPLARGLLFIAIVWSIAGAFLALEFGWSELLHQSIRAGWVREDRVLPIQVCRPQDIDAQEATASSPVDPAAMRQVRYATWMLGQRFGLAAAMAGASFPETETAPLLEDLQRWAATLHLPTPAPPKIQHIVNQFIEFGDHLEADPQCVAARLTSRYGPRYGYLYKFGAVIGHSFLARVLGVGGSFAVQIQFYGQGAGIPQELWSPMAQDSPAHLPGADPREKTIGAMARLDEYIRTSH
jgi:hypothetical protein